MVGYPSTSVGYRVWESGKVEKWKSGKVFNVAVPFIDEDVESGWWRKVDGGGGVQEEEEIISPVLPVDNLQQQHQVQPGGENIAAVDGEEELPLPTLVEDSNDDEDDGE